MLNLGGNWYETRTSRRVVVYIKSYNFFRGIHSQLFNNKIISQKMKPMLAHTYEPHRWTSGPVWLQPKLNGVRALYQNGRFQSRDELPWNPAVLAHLTEPLLKMFPPQTILDGELYFHGWPLQRINGAVQIARTLPSEDTPHICYYVFDQVKFDLPFYLRFQEVNDIIQLTNHDKICGVTTILAPDREFVEEFYTKFVAAGFEGIMYRLGACPYTTPKQPRVKGRGFLSDKDNRTWHLLKRKDWQDGEFEWAVLQEGEGKQKGMLGSFGCVTKTGATFSVGSGLTDAERIHYWNNPPNGKKIKVKFLTWTTDGKPFNPTVEAVL